MSRSRVAIIVLKGSAVVVAYTMLAVISTWPLVTHLSTHMTDHFGDGALHLWNSWWIQQALATGQPLFFTDRIFYPDGVSLVTQNFVWFHIIPALILAPFLNQIAAFNVAVLINLILCGVVMFWVAYRLCGNTFAAFIAGFIYQMWPYRLARLDLPNMLATYWIPLALLFLILAIENGRRRYAILSGVCLALVGYARWQFLIPAAIMSLIIVLFYVAFLPVAERRKLWTNLILHKDIVGRDRIAHWQKTLIARPRYEDETLIIYSTAPETGRDFDLPQGWAPGPAPLSVTLSADCLHPNHVLVASIGWGADEPPPSDLDARLSLIDRDGQEQLSARYPLVDGWPTSAWPANALAWGHYQLDLPGSLSPGAYDLALRLLDSSSADSDSEPYLLDQVTIQETICNLAVEEDAVDANKLFDDQLRLVEYSTKEEDDQLKLRLFWRGERFVTNEYTIFVHVFDRETAVPVAQYDGRPRNGAYLMRFWKRA